jgi:hypothetical protein
MSAGPSFRVKYICGKYGRLIATAMVLLSAVLFSAAVMAEPPEPQQETVQTDHQRVATTLAASSAVTRDSALYDEGETVTDSPVYLVSSNPTLDIEALTTVPSDQPVTVTQRFNLELSVSQGGEVFWTDRQTLANNTQQVTDGTARTTTTLDVAGVIQDRLAAIEADTDGVGTVEARITLKTSYDTGTYTGQTNLTAPLTISERSYNFDTPRQTERTHTTPLTKNVTATSSGAGAVAAAAGLPRQSVWLLGGGVSAGMVAIAVTLIRARIEDAERFERQYESIQYAEWISRGRIPDPSRYARIPVETLLDLVDIAIDSDKRVIYDTQQEYYAVIEGSLMYEFRDESDGPGRMHQFGLAPVEGEELTAEQAFQEAEAAVTGEDGDPVGS